MKESLTGLMRLTWRTLTRASRQYGVHRANRMAAAIAYRTVFALAPLLIIAVSIVGLVLGSSEQAMVEMVSAVEDVAGPQIATLIEDLLVSALDSTEVAAIVGLALLFWFSSSLFLEMQHDLNDVFEVPYERISGFAALVKKRGIGFLWALGLGLAILAVWFLNALWRFFGGLFPDRLLGFHEVVSYLTPLVSLAILPFVFGLVFQTMTAVKLRWRAVWWGGLFTSIVFVLAAYGIGVYFDAGGEPTALGFASSLVVVLFLAYLLSSVFLFGAEMTKVYSDHLDSVEVGSRSPLDGRGSEVLVAAPRPASSWAAVLGFLAGVFVGWRRHKR